MQNNRQTYASYQRSRSQQSSFVSSRLTQSVDNPINYDFIFNSWDTLSAGIADKIRSGSVLVDRSNQFPVIEERDERYPLLTSVREESLPTDQPKRSGISWISVSFGLANASIGVGLLNYPSIYGRIGGVELATGIQMAMMLFLMISMVIIIYCADIHGSCSYHEVLSSMCGPRAKVVVAFDIALATYGICIAYLVTMGDQYDRIFASLVGPDFCKHWHLNRKFMMTLTAIVIFPICLLKRLDFLKHTGPLGIFAMLYVVFLSVYEYFQVDPPAVANSVTEEKSISQIMACIPVILFGYQCNEVIVPIYASLKERKLRNFLKAAVAAYSVLILLYCTVGTFGYLSYGSSVAANVMLMFDASDPLVLLGIIALIFKMAVTYPQMSFAGREALTDIVREYSSATEQQAAAGERSWRFWSSVVWFASSLLIAAFVPNIGIVLQTLGVLAAVNVFICPALCLFFLARRKDMSHGTALKSMQVILAAILMLVGICFIVFVVGQIYVDVQRSLQDGTTSLCTA